MPFINILFILLAIAVVILLASFFYFLKVWVRAWMSGAYISLLNLVGMKLRGVPPTLIVDARIRAVKAGLPLTTDQLEAHFLAGGDVINVVQALIAADKANIELTFQRAAAIDLAGRDVYDAVRTSVNPKVIDCPDPAKGAGHARRRGQGRHPPAGQGPRDRARQPRPPRRRRHRGHHHRPRRPGHRLAIGSSPATRTCWKIPTTSARRCSTPASIPRPPSRSSPSTSPTSPSPACPAPAKSPTSAPCSKPSAPRPTRSCARPKPKAAAPWPSPPSRKCAPHPGNAGQGGRGAGRDPHGHRQAMKEGKLGVMDYLRMQNVMADTSMRESLAEGEKPPQA
jgi:hypothetical protein